MSFNRFTYLIIYLAKGCSKRKTDELVDRERNDIIYMSKDYIHMRYLKRVQAEKAREKFYKKYRLHSKIIRGHNYRKPTDVRRRARRSITPLSRTVTERLHSMSPRRFHNSPDYEGDYQSTYESSENAEMIFFDQSPPSEHCYQHSSELPETDLRKKLNRERAANSNVFYYRPPDQHEIDLFLNNINTAQSLEHLLVDSPMLRETNLQETPKLYVNPNIFQDQSQVATNVGRTLNPDEIQMRLRKLFEATQSEPLQPTKVEECTTFQPKAEPVDQEAYPQILENVSEPVRTVFQLCLTGEPLAIAFLKDMVRLHTGAMLLDEKGKVARRFGCDKLYHIYKLTIADPQLARHMFYGLKDFILNSQAYGSCDEARIRIIKVNETWLIPGQTDGPFNPNFTL